MVMIVRGATFLSVFDKPQRDALVLVREVAVVVDGKLRDARNAAAGVHHGHALLAGGDVGQPRPRSEAERREHKGVNQQPDGSPPYD
jgi:hypothetical protein